MYMKIRKREVVSYRRHRTTTSHSSDLGQSSSLLHRDSRPAPAGSPDFRERKRERRKSRERY